MKNKRKVKEKKVKFVGWGSKLLIKFLQSIGKDTDKQLSQYDVTAIINQYVHTFNLLHPVIKKKVVCDEKLRSLFGKKSIPRIKIHELLNSHFAENNDSYSSEYDYLYSSEEYDEDVKITCKKQKLSGLEKKVPYQKKKASETLLSCYAAIIPENIKLLYLKRSLVQGLVKHRKSFEGKLLGNYIRIESDADADAGDFSPKSYQLHPVTGVKYVPGNGDVHAKVLLQVPNMIKHIPISMLSDDDFSKEECDDLCQRVEDGLLKRPTVVEVQQKAQILHEDIIKHWLPRELASLQNLIDQANKKRQHKELFEYLERMKVLQTPSEQSKLLTNIPKVIADKLDEQLEDIKPPNSPEMSVYWDVLHPTFDLRTDHASPSHVLDSSGSSSEELTLTSSDDISSDNDFLPPCAYIKKKNKMVAKGKFNKPIGKKAVIIKSKTDAGKIIKKKKTRAQHNVPWIRTRSSPRTLSNVVRSLNDAQKKSVTDMGFKGILDLSFEEIPSKMGYWLVDNFDEKTCKLRMQHESLKITKKTIHQMLGVPMGGLQINATGFSKTRQVSKSSQVIKEWRTQFSKKGLIKPADIVEQIQCVKDAGRMFKLNFLVLFATTMAERSKGGSCNKNFLACIEKGEDIKNLDWCGYILYCLKTSKTSWNREDMNSYYTGPLTLLMVFYVDSTMCQSMKVSRNRPAIKGWTSELLKKREMAELKLGGFGKGTIELPLEVDEIEDDGTKKLEGDTTVNLLEADTWKDKEADIWEVNIKDEMNEDVYEDENNATWCEERQGELNTEEEMNEDVNNGAEVNDIQGFVGEIESRIKKINDTKVELDEIMSHALCRFPDSLELHKLKSQGKALFRQSTEHQETASNAKDAIDNFFKNAY